MQKQIKNHTLGLGLLIIVIGLGFLFRQFDVFSPKTEDVLFSWQMLLIVIGLYILVFGENKTAGFILILIGGFFLLPEIFTLPYNFRKSFWPVLLILLGVFILSRSGLFGRKQQEQNVDFHADEMNYLNEVNIFSGSDRKVTRTILKGGKITCIFGGSEIDLSEAELSPGTNVIEIFYLFGGTSLTVPRDWNVINKVTTVLGGFSDKRAAIPASEYLPEKTLIIRGLVVFGGGEIKTR